MRNLLLLLAILCCAPGCASMRRSPTVYENPIQVQAPGCDFLWDRLVDVVDDYFEIEKEERPKRVGNVVTAGRIDTLPQGGATLLEPWRGDSAGSYNKVESTFQSTRRRAVVVVIPTDDGGYLVDVAVYKELEDVPRPDFAPTAVATFRTDDSLSRIYSDPVADASVPTIGWIAQGRDCVLEQTMICKLLQLLNDGH
jgi:hypothetical protein